MDEFNFMWKNKTKLTVQSAFLSAQTVKPKLAFSTLQPLVIKDYVNYYH